MVSDPLTDTVRALDLSGAVFLKAEFTAPWAITAHVTAEDCRPFLPVPQRVLAYHVITEGEVVLSLDQGPGYRPRFKAKAGDVILLPANPLHVLASGPGQIPPSGDDLLLPAGEDGLVRITYGGGGRTTRLMCGFMASNSGPTPLLDMLPDVMIINVESLLTRGWIETSVAIAARELASERLSGRTMISGLCQLLLVEALRQHLESSKYKADWLPGISHPRISRALARIHADVSRSFPVATLAAEVGMSRSAFVDRFTELVGVGPRRYILRNRMQTASRLLRETDLTLAEVAHRVGYDAPEAFSRAFKRENGRAPSDWRRFCATGTDATKASFEEHS
ncbi:MAG: AraC family transcriptional regulator [Pseudomonadota bacterium]